MRQAHGSASRPTLRVVQKALAIYSLSMLALSIVAGAAKAFPCFGSCGPVVAVAGGGYSCAGRCATYLCSCFLVSSTNQYGQLLLSCDCN